MSRRVLCFVVLVLGSVSLTPDARATIPWSWPVVGPIIKGYDPPDDPYGAGHRGIDIGAPVGTVVVAPEDGVVTFAGKVGGRLFLTVDHGAGVLSTCSYLMAVLVHKGDRVSRGQPVATSGWGHADEPVPHLHFGVRLDGVYVDPLAYLGRPPVSSLIRLAPIDAAPSPSVAAASSAASRMTGLAHPTMARAARARGPGGARGPGERGPGRRDDVAPVPGWRGPHRGDARRDARAALPRLVARRDGDR
jgi:hypothetical protein